MRNYKALRRGLPAACVLSLAAFAFNAPARADAVSDYYAGKTFSIISGFTPNGEFDTYFRLLGRHLGKHIPGKPQVVNSNLPGAGTLIAANNLATKVAPDGLTVSTFTSHATVEPLLDNKSANFDPRKFNFIGSMTQDVQFCVVRTAEDAPRSIDELKSKETVFGSSMPSSDIYKHTAVVKKTLGVKIKLVTGYAGMPAVNLALARGEVAGVCGHTPMSLRTNMADALKNGRIRLLVQMGNKTTREFGDVPSVFDLPTTPEGREVLEFFFRSMALGHPVVAPPGVPAERVAALREAFMATLKDPEFVAEAQKLNLAIDPSTGAELEAQYNKVAALPREFFARVKAAVE